MWPYFPSSLPACGFHELISWLPLSALLGLDGLVYGLASAVIREWTSLLACICLLHSVQAFLHRIVSTGISTFLPPVGCLRALANPLCFPGFKRQVHVQKTSALSRSWGYSWIATEQSTVGTLSGLAPSRSAWRHPSYKWYFSCKNPLLRITWRKFKALSPSNSLLRGIKDWLKIRTSWLIK